MAPRPSRNAVNRSRPSTTPDPLKSGRGDPTIRALASKSIYRMIARWKLLTSPRRHAPRQRTPAQLIRKQVISRAMIQPRNTREGIPLEVTDGGVRIQHCNTFPSFVHIPMLGSRSSSVGSALWLRF